MALWLLNFFQVPQPANLVVGEVGVATAWRWLTYPLYTPTSILGIVFLGYIFFWIGGSLERRWGSEKFAQVFVVVTLAAAGAQWLGSAYAVRSLNPDFALAGLYIPEATLFVIWAALNPEATILLFFVLPIKAKYLGLGSIVVTYFSSGGPVQGLFAIAVPVLGWFWAKRPASGRPSRPKPSISERFEKRRREKKKSRFKLVEGQGQKAGPKTVMPDLKALNKEAEEKQKTANEAELDRILDKIRFEGMASLTDEEKETLDRQSRKLKGEF